MLTISAVIMGGYGNLTKQGLRPCTMQRTKTAEKRGKLRNMGSPKGRNTYGDGTFIVGSNPNKMLPTGWYPWNRRGAGLRLYVTKAAITGENSLSGSLIKHRSVNMENEEHTNDKLIHLIADPKTLTLAYELIKSKPGNMTRGTKSETLDGISKS